MHPLFRSRTALLAYAFAWLLIALQVATTLHATAGMGGHDVAVVTLLLTGGLAVACLTPWYLCRALPIRTTKPLKLIVSLWLATALLNGAIIGWVRLAIHFAKPWLATDLPRHLKEAMPALTSVVFLVYLLSTALHYMMLAMEQGKQAEVLSREAELRALKAQINPHFLFNSLNSISALALAQPARAREMCIRLSDFLRTSLRMGEQLTIPLAEELALTRNYLDVEQIRFGARLRVKQNIEPGCETCEVPPLLVQPLVENAIKHGIATLVEGGEVMVSGTRKGDMVTVRVENPFDRDAPRVNTNGLGLVNVRNRLQARYGGSARMDIQVSSECYQVTLELPCTERGR